MTERLRVALCYQCDPRDAEDVFYRVVPSGLLNLHGVLRRAGHESRVFNFSGVSPREAGKRLAEFGPGLVGVSHFTYNHRASERLLVEARRACPGALLVSGGAQATFLDEALLRTLPALDATVRGEGEIPLLALAECSGREPWNLETVPGLSWREPGGGVRRNPDPPLLEDLDAVYGLERFSELDGVVPEEQFPFLVTTRGCPAECTFCSSPRFWQRKLRFRSASSLLEEVAFLRRRYGFRYFSIRDDSFTVDRGRLRELCQALEAQGILWNCQSRVNLVDAERLGWMKRAGCNSIQFGIESASDSVLKWLHKSFSVRQVKEALRLCREVGIRTCAYFITGIPGMRSRDVEDNLRLFSECGLQQGIVAPLVYFPGTALYEEARRQGRTGEDDLLSGNQERLLVRNDGEAWSQYERMAEACSMSFNPYGRSDLERHLALSDRCLSSLMDWEEFMEAEGKSAEAERACLEAVKRWPQSPWGYEAMASLLGRMGRRREVRGWKESAEKASMGQVPDDSPSPDQGRAL